MYSVEGEWKEKMPSRRRVLAGTGVVVAGGAVGGYAGKWPISLDGDAIWPMARHDPAGTGATDEPGPKSEPGIRWQTETDEYFGRSGPPILVGDTLIATGDRSVVALDRQTGGRRYKRTGTYRTTPVLAQADAYRSDVLVTGNQGGFAGLAASGGFALGDITVGHERWQTPAKPSGGWAFTAASQAGAVASDGTIYASVPNTNRLVAIDANSGRVEWTYRVGNIDYRDVNRPVLRDGTVYATSTVNRVVALDAETGTRQWRVDIEPPQREDFLGYTMPNAPTVTPAGLVVPTSAFVDLRSLDDGSRTWRYLHDGTNAARSAAVADGTVALTDDEKSLYGISLDSGERLWQTEYLPDTNPIVADGVVYLSYDFSPELSAFDAATGDPLWTKEIPASPSQPIVDDGVLYIGTFEGMLALEDRQ